MGCVNIDSVKGCIGLETIYFTHDRFRIGFHHSPPACMHFVFLVPENPVNISGRFYNLGN